MNIHDYETLWDPLPQTAEPLSEETIIQRVKKIIKVLHSFFGLFYCMSKQTANVVTVISLSIIYTPTYNHS